MNDATKNMVAELAALSASQKDSGDAMRFSQAALNIANAERVVADMPKSKSATDDAGIKHMVNRFLGWKLPANFRPDCGIKFDAMAAKKIDEHNHVYEPVGTNLFDAEQAEAMVRYMLEGIIVE